MRIALLGSPDSWYARDLARAAGDRHTLTSLPFSRIAASVDVDAATVTSTGESLDDYDSVIVRSMPPGSLEQVIFRMDALGRVEAAGTLVLNPPRALEASIDKYLSLARLAEVGLTVPATIVCQTEEDALNAFDVLGGNVVVKPLFGGEGRGILRVSDPALAQRTFRTLEQLNAVLYLQVFIEHEGCDLRLLVIGKTVLGMRRINAVDWRTNVSRGASTEPLEVDEHLADIAMKAARALNTPLAGVDVLPGRDGKLYLLEVNAVPGWRALASTLQVDVANRVLDYVVGRLDGREAFE